MPHTTPTFMPPDALHQRLQFLLMLAPLHETGSLEAASTLTETFLPVLTIDAEHGNVSSVQLTERDGKKLVAVTIQGRNPRFLLPLDYVALDLAAAFGLRLTIQKTTADPDKRKDYPRISSPGPNGYVFQVLRLLTDAQPGQVAKQRPGFDHHYLGRDGLTLTTDDAERDQGRAIRTTTRGRADLLACATRCFETNRPKFDLPQDFDAERYSQLLTLAFGLADWLHGGTLTTQPSDTLSAA